MNLIYDHLLRLNPQAARCGAIDSRDNPFLSADKASVGLPRERGLCEFCSPAMPILIPLFSNLLNYGLKHS